LKHAHCQNCCIDSNQILHNTKDRRVLIVGGPNTPSRQIQDGDGRYLEKLQKSRYLSNGLTDLREIWQVM